MNLTLYQISHFVLGIDFSLVVFADYSDGSCIFFVSIWGADRLTEEVVFWGNYEHHGTT